MSVSRRRTDPTKAGLSILLMMMYISLLKKVTVPSPWSHPGEWLWGWDAVVGVPKKGLNCDLPNGPSYKAISETMRTPVGQS